MMMSVRFKFSVKPACNVPVSNGISVLFECFLFHLERVLYEFSSTVYYDLIPDVSFLFFNTSLLLNF